MKIKTSELTGRALDWAMALVMGMSWWTPHTARWSTADGYTDWVLAADGRLKKYVFDGSSSRSGHWDIQEVFEPSTDWSQGGPLYEQADCLLESTDDSDPERKYWCSGLTVQPEFSANPHPCGAYGPTKLVAFCRWRVSAGLGAEVDVPVELL